jgi:hypothetical protein
MNKLIIKLNSKRVFPVLLFVIAVLPNALLSRTKYSAPGQAAGMPLPLPVDDAEEYSDDIYEDNETGPEESYPDSDEYGNGDEEGNSEDYSEEPPEEEYPEEEGVRRRPL